MKFHPNFNTSHEWIKRTNQKKPVPCPRWLNVRASGVKSLCVDGSTTVKRWISKCMCAPILWSDDGQWRSPTDTQTTKDCAVRRMRKLSFFFLSLVCCIFYALSHMLTHATHIAHAHTPRQIVPFWQIYTRFDTMLMSMSMPISCTRLTVCVCIATYLLEFNAYWSMTKRLGDPETK